MVAPAVLQLKTTLLPALAARLDIVREPIVCAVA